MISSTSDSPSNLPRAIPDVADEVSYVLVSSAVLPVADTAESEHILKLRMMEGKKDQILYLQSVLPRSMSFIESRLSKGESVCVCCDSGKDASVGVALAALQLFFDDAGRLQVTYEGQDRLSKSFAYEIVQWKKYIIFVREHSLETVYQYKITMDHLKQARGQSFPSYAQTRK